MSNTEITQPPQVGQSRLTDGLGTLLDGSDNGCYPAWLCITCGMKYGNRTPKFATWHEDECGICGKRESVTEPRNFGHLKQNWREIYETNAPNATVRRPPLERL